MKKNLYLLAFPVYMSRALQFFMLLHYHIRIPSHLTRTRLRVTPHGDLLQPCAALFRAHPLAVPGAVPGPGLGPTGAGLGAGAPGAEGGPQRQIWGEGVALKAGLVELYFLNHCIITSGTCS